MKIKNIVTGFALVVVIGLLIAGALNRTLSKTDGSISLFNQEENPIGRYLQTNETASTEANGTTADQAQGQGGGRWQTSETSSIETDGTTAGQAQGQGGGRWSQETSSSQVNVNAQPYSEESGTGQADVQEWVSINGTVTEADPAYLVITADDGTLIEVGGRPWSYIQSQEFSLESGSTVALQGFYETEDRFEIGVITNLSTGEDIAIRDLTGRPMWAGGRRGGQNIDG